MILYMKSIQSCQLSAGLRSPTHSFRDRDKSTAHKKRRIGIQCGGYQLQEGRDSELYPSELSQLPAWYPSGRGFTGVSLTYELQNRVNLHDSILNIKSTRLQEA